MKNETMPWLNEAFERAIKTGRELERDRYMPLLAALFEEYHSACQDPNTKMPSRLHLAFMAATLEFGNVHKTKAKKAA